MLILYTGEMQKLIKDYWRYSSYPIQIECSLVYVLMIDDCLLFQHSRWKLNFDWFIFLPFVLKKDGASYWKIHISVSFFYLVQREFSSVQAWWSLGNMINALVWHCRRKLTGRSWHHIRWLLEKLLYSDKDRRRLSLKMKISPWVGFCFHAGYQCILEHLHLKSKSTGI